MACATCGTTILFGGKKSGERKYCSDKCLEADEIGRIADTIDQYEVDLLADKLRHSNCPKCNKNSDLEVFKSYFIYSVILYTSWKENTQFSCRSCARKKQIKDFFSSFLFGWWGFPFGVLGTPIVLIMNIIYMFKDPRLKAPSKELNEHSRFLIADQILHNHTD